MLPLTIFMSCNQLHLSVISMCEKSFNTFKLISSFESFHMDHFNQVESLGILDPEVSNLIIILSCSCLHNHLEVRLRTDTQQLCGL